MSVTTFVTLSLSRTLRLNRNLSDNNLPYEPAKLCDRNGDLSKSWLIEFECWSEPDARLKRKQKRIPAKLKSAEARKAWADKMIPLINRVLSEGYHIKVESKAPTPSTIPSIAKAFELANNVLMVRLARQSRRNFRSLKNRFIARMQARGRASMPITTLSRADFQEFLDNEQTTKAVKNRTRNSNLSYFKTFVKHFVANEWISQDPTVGMARHRETEPEIKAYADEEKKQIMAYLNQHDPQLQLYLRMIYYTYRRCTETRLIQLKHINFEGNSIHIPPDNAKGGKAQTIYFSERLRTQLMEMGCHQLNQDWYLFGNAGTPGAKHYSDNALGNRYRKHLKAMGIFKPGITIMYAWKHTGITDGHELAGIKPRTSQDQAGHASLDMHMRYLRRLGVDKASEIDNMPDI